jgi:hypothetical protein
MLIGSMLASECRLFKCGGIDNAGKSDEQRVCVLPEDDSTVRLMGCRKCFSLIL